jgi:colanic acid biosynthesis glycosyl transferase WcaI
MKILFLTSEGFDTPNSTNHLAETLLEDLLKCGIEVHSITSHKTGTYSDIPDALLAYDKFSYDIVNRDIIDKNNFVKRYIDEVKYAFRARKIWKKHKKSYDAVLLQSNPNSVVNAVLLSSLKKPIVLNLYDVFPGHAMSIGVIKNKLVFNVLRIIQKVLYRKCKYIVAMSDDMKKQLIDEKVPDEKVKVIRNWFDDDIFEPIPREENEFFKKYELDPSKFYVQFAGLLGYVFDYKMYIDVAERLADHPEIVFTLIGDGTQRAVVDEEIEKRGIKNILRYPWQPLEIIAHVYSACDIGIIPLKPGVIGNGIPSKACQLMAARRVILNSVEKSEYTDTFEEYDMGENVTDHSAESVANRILYLYENKERRDIIGENARRYAYEHYSRKKNTAQFAELLLSLESKK